MNWVHETGTYIRPRAAGQMNGALMNWAHKVNELGPEDRVEQLSPSDCTNELDLWS